MRDRSETLRAAAAARVAPSSAWSQPGSRQAASRRFSRAPDRSDGLATLRPLDCLRTASTDKQGSKSCVMRDRQPQHLP